MKVGDTQYQSIWIDDKDPEVIRVIDQQKLPFFFDIKELRSVEDVFNAISGMIVRGAPVIGVTAAFGMYLATLEINPHTNVRDHLGNAARYLISSRPTAVNLAWAVNLMLSNLDDVKDLDEMRAAALTLAKNMLKDETGKCRAIGEAGLPLIERISVEKDGAPVNILTHCNAGWLACVDYGTALAPVYLAHHKKIPLHVWVDETRPLNQGARLTAWELANEGIPHTLITDNAGGHLMMKNMIDMVIVGSDRTTRTGDVANKIGTYLKALAAHDNKIPFYVALPTSSIDLDLDNGMAGIPVEERDPDEVTNVPGFKDGQLISVRICPEVTRAANYGFDITPSRLVTALITERGVCMPNEKEIVGLFSE
jgi:methylthioribose-1-phosphate isomerase